MSAYLLLPILVVGLQLASAYPGEDPQCKSLKAEAYAPFTQLDHGGWAFVVEDIQLFGDDADKAKKHARNNKVDKNALDNLKGYMATTAPPSENINIPASVACKYFNTCSSSVIRHSCSASFKLGFKMGGHWFYATSEALVNKSTKDADNTCKLNLYPTADETVWFGQPFLNYHCTFNDRKHYLGVARIAQNHS